MYSLERFLVAFSFQLSVGCSPSKPEVFFFSDRWHMISSIAFVFLRFCCFWPLVLHHGLQWESIAKTPQCRSGNWQNCNIRGFFGGYKDFKDSWSKRKTPICSPSKTTCCQLAAWWFWRGNYDRTSRLTLFIWILFEFRYRLPADRFWGHDCRIIYQDHPNDLPRFVRLLLNFDGSGCFRIFY